MAKRKKKKTIANPKGVSKREDRALQAFREEREEAKVDYGGMPWRDIKKNLGCG